MRIDQLIWFMEYFKLKSLTDASKNLNITPQAISISLKRLEDELGLPLFTKNGRNITLTESGKLLFNLSNSIIPEYRNFLLKINEIKNNKIPVLKGNLTIYASMLFQRTMLHCIVNSFSTDFPDVKINIFESDSVNIFKEFTKPNDERNITKIAFCQRPLLTGISWDVNEDFIFNRIYKGGYYACAGNKINIGSRESIKKLIKYPAVIYASHQNSLGSYGKWIKNPILMALEEWGKVNISFSVNRMELWRQTLLNHRCIGYIHSFLVRHGDSSMTDLKLIEIKENIQTELGWITPRKKSNAIDEMEKKIASYMTAFYNNTE